MRQEWAISMLGQISDPHCVAWSHLVSVSVVTMVICHNSYNGQNKVAIIAIILFLYYLLLYFLFLRHILST